MEGEGKGGKSPERGRRHEGKCPSRQFFAECYLFLHAKHWFFSTLLVGVAPFNRDSGMMRGKRAVWGGRAHVRSALYMGALVATRYNPTIQVFYKRLKDNGKKPKVALTACMRKLLVILNTMVRNGTHWNPILQES